MMPYIQEHNAVTYYHISNNKRINVNTANPFESITFGFTYLRIC